MHINLKVDRIARQKNMMSVDKESRINYNTIEN